ncbi:MULTISPECIES: conserved virulence factor C family protein [Bacillaceae]|uniref:Conserved virulence factor C family protein n=1 Tax=Evansella alkalicola TaxID=745819 RepID=A0ABS6JZ71_9BACI|nr:MULTISPECIES: conserved virulence factor C family protein [Bacillaceae]MBU9723891.1 conserved virulence factor C family protein [Bacillus alkalicola]
MKILSVEPTPSPNTMKLTLSKELPQGKSHNYTKTNTEGAPDFVKKIFEVEGVKGVYHVADFIAVERNAKYDWKVILPKVRAVFGEVEESNEKSETKALDDHFGEVNVQVHMFKGIPIQVKAFNNDEEVRVGLPDMFKESTVKATLPDDNIVMQRKWVDYKARYGELEEVAEEVAEEVKATYTKGRLESLVEEAQNPSENKSEKLKKKWLHVTPDMLDEPDWRKRFAILEQMDPSKDDLPVLEKALNDEKASIRRLAVVYLGMIEDELVLPYLYKALKDPSVTVRRTAGDSLSDIGSPKAIPAMIEALEDKSKLVRWRAAMYLYEVGDETAIAALEKAEDDPEFEVSMQIKLAIERIKGGEEAKGSVWKQMTEAMEKNK